MIFLSAIVVPIILLPFITELPPSVLDFLEICDLTVVSLFIFEYFSKLYLAESKWKHFKSPWHIIDLVIIILPFIQFLPIGLTVSGSPSLLLRLLRLPRALAVGGRAMAGRRTNQQTASTAAEKESPTIIRQVGSDLTTIHDEFTWEDLKTHMSDNQRQEWLDIHNISSEGFAKLSEILQISEPHFKSSLMDEIYPHIDYVQKASFIFLQSGQIMYPEHAGHFLTISRSGIIVICNGPKIITVSRHQVDMMKQVLTSVSQNRTNNSFAVPVLYGILERMLNDYKAMLSEIEIEVIKIGGTSRSKLPRDFLERIYQLDREVNRLVSNLVHFKDLLVTIISKKVPLEGFNKSSEEAFYVLQEGATYLNEIADDLTANLRSIIDLYINQTSFEANRILKILAVITAISVIPSAVSGILGTNLLDTPYGATLWQLSFLITVSMSFVAYTFVKLGWLKT